MAVCLLDYLLSQEVRRSLFDLHQWSLCPLQLYCCLLMIPSVLIRFCLYCHHGVINGIFILSVSSCDLLPPDMFLLSQQYDTGYQSVSLWPCHYYIHVCLRISLGKNTSYDFRSDYKTRLTKLNLLPIMMQKCACRFPAKNGNTAPCNGEVLDLYNGAV